MPARQNKRHLIGRIGWLRAAVLGANDGILSTFAAQLMAHDALGAHARGELGISRTQRVHPVQAALASAASFTVGAALPLVTVFAPVTSVIPPVSGMSLAFLAILGGSAKRALKPIATPALVHLA